MISEIQIDQMQDLEKAEGRGRRPPAKPVFPVVMMSRFKATLVDGWKWGQREKKSGETGFESVVSACTDSSGSI